MIPLQTPDQALRPTAVALGSFDGLHQGHRRVIAAVTGSQRTAGACAPVPTVVSFWPHPREVLFGETRLRLDLPGEKLALLEPLGIRQLVMVPFTRKLAALSPEAFVQTVLEQELQARCIAVGENFRFGTGRSGSADDLARIGAARGIEVSVLPMLWDGNERVSSSRIRRALAAGEISEACRLLDRPYRFTGRVVPGRGLGRRLGWPTANLQVDGRKFLPLEGVYAALAWRVRGDSDGDWAFGPSVASAVAMEAVMNLGPQPTVDPCAPSAVEVHLIDRRMDLEGDQLLVQPVQLLRPQHRFASLEALTDQIRKDAHRAAQVLRERSAPAQE